MIESSGGALTSSNTLRRCLAAALAIAGAAALVAGAAAAAASPATVAAAPPAGGAPTPPELRLPPTARPTAYDVRLRLSPDREEFTGTITIELELQEATRLLWLNGTELTVKRAVLSAAGRERPAALVPGGDDFIGFAFEGEVGPGPAALRIDYAGKALGKESSGVFRQEEGGDSYLFTQFEETDARRAFPCFDEPAYKVPWRLTIETRRKFVVLSNTPVESEAATRGGMKEVRFARTKPLPSYLVAFAVGPFDLVDLGVAGGSKTPLRIAVPRGLKPGADYAAKTAPELFAAAERWFGIPYPYEKLDLVAVPFFFGAMENAGLITFGRDLLLASPGEDSLERRRRYATFCAHEIAHQWFGDLVTMAWWDDTWLNESFASWMENKIVGPWKPEWNLDAARVDDRARAMSRDSFASARKIHQPVESSEDIASAFDRITYSKGSAILSMFERWVGPEKFRRGVRRYLQAHAWGSATTGDFLAAMSEEAGVEFAPAFSTFIEQPGVPLVTMDLSCEAGAAASLGILQKRYLPLGSTGKPDHLWQIPICVRYGGDAGPAAARPDPSESGDRRPGEGAAEILPAGGGEAPPAHAGEAPPRAAAEWGRQCFLVGQFGTLGWSGALERAGSCPAWIVPDVEEAGYYRWRLPRGMAARLLDGGGANLTPAEALGAFDNLSALVASGDLPAAELLAMIPAIAKEGGERLVASAAGFVSELDPHLLTEELRPGYQKFIRRTFGPRARALGFAHAPGENEETRLLRPALIRLVAGKGGDPTLASEARRLASLWLTTRKGVDPDMIDVVLALAARDGDASLFDRLLAEARKSRDREERVRLLAAVGQFRDPALVTRRNAILLGREFETRDALVMMMDREPDPVAAQLFYDFLKQNFDALAGRLPRQFVAYAPDAGSQFCDAAHRDDVERFFREKVAKAPGGQYMLSRVLEQIELCAAEKQGQQGSVAEFLRRE